MTLTFTEPVAPIGISLIGVGTPPRALDFTQPDGPIVVIPLPTGLADGSYLLSWRVTSADGHPVNGTVDFVFGASSGAIAEPAPNFWLDAAIWLTRAAQFLAVFLGVGSLATSAVVVLPPSLARTARGLALGGLLLVPISLALQGLDLLGDDAAALLSPMPWLAAGASVYAQTQAAYALAFAVALLPGRWSGVAGAVLAIAAPTLSGHVVTAPPQGLTRTILAIHIASLLAWLGALVPLLVTLAGRDLRLLLKFSAYAPFAIAGLLASGLGMALVQLGPADADWLSPYGVLLWCKLALVGALLVLALFNRVQLTALAAGGDTRRLRRSIVAELVLVVLVVGVVAGWRFTPPPRILAEIEAANAPVSVTLASAGKSATLSVSPGRAGPVALKLSPVGAARAVTLKLANPAYGISTISRPATLSPDGSWRVTGLVLPAGGDWQVEAQIRVDDFDQDILRGTLVLPPTERDDPMKLSSLAAAAASSMLAVSPAAAGPGVLATCPTGQSFVAGDITVSGAFTRATPKGAQSAGGYLTVANAGAEPDTLTGATSAAASDVTLHTMSMDGNVMKMAPVEGGISIPAGGSVALSPMGYHLMLTGMGAPFVEGQCVDMVLHFAHAGDVAVELNVGGLGQSTPPGDDMGGMGMDHDMSGMGSSSMAM